MIRADSWSSRADLVHGFTRSHSRNGAPLDLGSNATAGDWRMALGELGLASDTVALVSQVHGVDILEATVPGLVGEADALFTTCRGLPIAVRTADCVPVLLAGRGVVAAVHAGWRGAAAGIVPRAVDFLARRGLATGLEAVIGPAIAGERYEVGPEVVEAFRAAGVPDPAFLRRPPGAHKDHVDVKGAVAWQLAAAGVRHVEVLPQCTFADRSLHSWRRDGPAAGRLAAVIALC